MALTSVTWDDRTYQFDMDSPTIAEMSTMREFTGYNWLPMVDQMRDGNDVVLSAALWMMLNRAGQPCNIGEAPWPAGKGPMDFYKALQDGVLVEPPGAADPNGQAAGSIPSSPGNLLDGEGSTSGKSEPNTSTTSPGSESPRLLSTA